MSKVYSGLADYALKTAHNRAHSPVDASVVSPGGIAASFRAPVMPTSLMSFLSVFQAFSPAAL
jgi:hypothetical protein